ncbi:MAG: helix-turn-helix domain-containing protein [Acidimicrobiales bacterium]
MERTAADDPKSRILTAAMRCFADKGYAATTMADIEVAAGFQPRTGGTYRHFRSKRAILDAALESEMVATRDDISTMPAPADADGILDGARRALAALDRQRDLMRVMFRDLDAFPELFEHTVDQLIQRTYRETAAHYASLAPGVDAEALAAVSLGALVNFKIIQAFTGRTPNDVDDERFARAWAQVFGAAAATAADRGLLAPGGAS